MTNSPINASEQKPASPAVAPAQTPQQQTQGDNKPNTEKPAQQQQK